MSMFSYIFTAFTGWETANKYKIKNSMGQQVYFAAEGKFGNVNQGSHRLEKFLNMEDFLEKYRRTTLKP